MNTHIKNTIIGTAFSEENTSESYKPIWQQIATDNEGRQRFHGAFTGGFSAGYYNTVGSEKGFTPKTFISSRKNRVSSQKMKPKDFMDEEDLNQFTEGGKNLLVRNQFKDTYFNQPQSTTSNKLRNIVAPVIDSIGITLLKRMGWKENQGIGPRVKKVTEHNSTIKIPPKNIPLFKISIKDNLFGIGYDPYKNEEIAINISKSKFDSSSKNQIMMGFQDTSSSHLGLSVLEDQDDDENVYFNETMKNYDKDIDTNNKNQRNDKNENFNNKNNSNLINEKGIFIPSRKQERKIKKFNKLKIPSSFDCKHRFDLPGITITEDMKRFNIRIPNRKKIILTKKRLTANERGNLLGEKPLPNIKSKNSLLKTFSEGKILNLNLSNKAGGISYIEKKLDPWKSLLNHYKEDPNKQNRFYNYINERLSYKAISKCRELNMMLTDIQKREEIKEFEMEFNYFSKKNPSHEVFRESLDKEEKVFRVVKTWKPDRLLCKRFNVPAPFVDKEEKDEMGKGNKKSDKDKIENTEVNEEIDEEDEKPSVDLFKAIFEDGSDSEGDELRVGDVKEELKEKEGGMNVNIRKNNVKIHEEKKKIIDLTKKKSKIIIKKDEKNIIGPHRPIYKEDIIKKKSKIEKKREKRKRRKERKRKRKEMV